LLPTVLFGQDSVYLKTDISNEWQAFNSKTKTYRKISLNERTSSLRLSLPAHRLENVTIEIASPDKPILLVNGKLIDIVSDTIRIDPTDLGVNASQAPLELSLYSKSGIRSGLLHTILIQKTKSAGESGRIYDRIRSSFTNNFIIVCLLLVAYLAFLVNKFPKDSGDFAQILNSLTMLNRDEALISSRPLGRNNLLFIVLNSFLLGFNLVTLHHLIPEYFSIQLFANLSFLLEWLIVSTIIFALITGKYLLIALFTGLFVLGEFKNIQFFNDVRISLVVSLLTFISISFTFLTFNSPALSIYSVILYGVVVLLALRMLIIFLKLLNYSMYKTFHLIIYLCATELFPFLLTYKIVLG